MDNLYALYCSIQYRVATSDERYRNYCLLLDGINQFIASNNKVKNSSIDTPQLYWDLTFETQQMMTFSDLMQLNNTSLAFIDVKQTMMIKNCLDQIRLYKYKKLDDKICQLKALGRRLLQRAGEEHCLCGQVIIERALRLHLLNTQRFDGKYDEYDYSSNFQQRQEHFKNQVKTTLKLDNGSPLSQYREYRQIMVEICNIILFPLGLAKGLAQFSETGNFKWQLFSTNSTYSQISHEINSCLEDTDVSLNKEEVKNHRRGFTHNP